jgi:uncharacterized protein (TIGR02145 family)
MKPKNVKPTVVTLPVSDITYHSAESGAEFIIETGITSYGLNYFINSDSKINYTIKRSVTDSRTSSYGEERPIHLEGLVPNTIYHVQAFGITKTEKVYGSDLEFTTLPFDKTLIFNSGLIYGSLSDNEGNTYKTIQIGTQVWMAENLIATKYRDGSSIQNIEDEKKWYADTIGAYCLFKNGLYYGNTFGNLYNFYAVAGQHNLCPTGWHVPSIAEWTILEVYLGNNAGGKLKEAGTTHWDSPNTGATNESGFTAIPGSSRIQGFDDVGNFGGWWSFPKHDASTSLTIEVGSKSNLLFVGKEGFYFNFGLSVRCLKDN